MHIHVSFIGGGNRSTWEKTRPSVSHWQTSSHNVASNTPRPARNNYLNIKSGKQCGCGSRISDGLFFFLFFFGEIYGHKKTKRAKIQQPKPWTYKNKTIIWLLNQKKSSDLMADGTRIPGENHRPEVSHWQTLSHNVVSIRAHYTTDGY